jgi:hypothetical protein
MSAIDRPPHRLRMRDLLSGGQRSFCQFLRRFVGDYVAVELVVFCANMHRRAEQIR